MEALRKTAQAGGVDVETAALLIEAASVVGRPLQASLRYKLMLKARSLPSVCESSAGGWIELRRGKAGE